MNNYHNFVIVRLVENYPMIVIFASLVLGPIILFMAAKGYGITRRGPSFWVRPGKATNNDRVYFGLFGVGFLIVAALLIFGSLTGL